MNLNACFCGCYLVPDSSIIMCTPPCNTINDFTDLFLSHYKQYKMMEIDLE